MLSFFYNGLVGQYGSINISRPYGSVVYLELLAGNLFQGCNQLVQADLWLVETLKVPEPS